MLGKMLGKNEGQIQVGYSSVSRPHGSFQTEKSKRSLLSLLRAKDLFILSIFKIENYYEIIQRKI